MKKCLFFTVILGFLFSACDLLNLDKDSLSGPQSAIGKAGTTITSSTSPIGGVSSMSFKVNSLDNGISSLSGSATITNPVIKNVLANFPGVTFTGNTATANIFKFKVTTEGIESITGFGKGIIVKYSSNVGDTYSAGSSERVRTVLSKSTTDDYGWGGMLIKVIEVEDNYHKNGIKKITYYGNHRFGLVGVTFTFDDGSSLKYPLYISVENQ